MFCLTCDRLGVPRPVSVQNDFNFNNRTFETSCAEACHHLGVVGMPYGALGGGALTGKYQAVWKSTSVSGAPDNSSLSHFSAMTRPSWLGRAARNRHRHAIEQASRRWRGGRRDDSARTRRKILISTQVGAADFSCGRVRPAPYRRGANDGAPFVEHWRNPYLKRGVPRGADDLTVGLSTLGKAPPGPPFCPRAGNTSAVHTNGLFATIERAKSVRVK